MSIEALIEKAKKAPAPTGALRVDSRWADLYPVLEQLRAKGYTYDGSIDWLIKNKAMDADDRGKAKNAFWQLKHRKTKPKKDKP